MTAEWGDLAAFRSTAEGLTDAKQARIATVNRVERGGTADALLGQQMIALARNLETTYEDMLATQYEQAVPAHVREWAAAIPGFGSGVLFARILGVLGHPRIAVPYRWEGRDLIAAGPPYDRTVRQLWQYAGCGDPERHPVKDMTRDEKLAMGKRTTLRPLLYTFSSYLEKSPTRSPAVAGSRYYKLLTTAKEAAQGNTHARECRNRKRPPMTSNGCGTVQHPEWGEPGSPWRPGHIRMHAHRIVHKEFLRDLWVIAGQ